MIIEYSEVDESRVRWNRGGEWKSADIEDLIKAYERKNCGAKMDDDWEEPEINPCRGCDDYDGRGGCKSHGGCGAERSKDAD